jgi:hypothetical protein
VGAAVVATLGACVMDADGNGVPSGSSPPHAIVRTASENNAATRRVAVDTDGFWPACLMWSSTGRSPSGSRASATASSANAARGAQSIARASHCHPIARPAQRPERYHVSEVIAATMPPGGRPRDGRCRTRLGSLSRPRGHGVVVIWDSARGIRQVPCCVYAGLIPDR